MNWISKYRDQLGLRFQSFEKLFDIAIERKLKTIVETGTARGFSSICMSKALIDQKKSGKIISLDCISHNEKIFWKRQSL